MEDSEFTNDMQSLLRPGISFSASDACVENEIEPTEDLCKELIDTKGQSLRKQYSEIRATPITKQGAEKIPNTKAEEVMPKATLNQKVFFSQYLTAYSCWTNIKQALEENGIAYLLPFLTSQLFQRNLAF